MGDSTQLVCPNCDAVNRAPVSRNPADASCGRCHHRLFQRQPIEVTGPQLQRHIERGQIPVLADFWASWCGPCKMMAPAFAQAAARLEPRIRLVKVDTETEQASAARYGIRSIPTLILFKDGQEAARLSGAVDLGSLVRWVEQHLQ